MQHHQCLLCTHPCLGDPLTPIPTLASSLLMDKHVQITTPVCYRLGSPFALITTLAPSHLMRSCVLATSGADSGERNTCRSEVETTAELS